MARKTLIFGNGIGMALSPANFSLDRAIGAVWDNPTLLGQEYKQLICQCLPSSCVERPRSESELDTLQLALSACDFLSGITGSNIHWLSEQGQRFPAAVRMFIYQTAIHFHECSVALPNSFLSALADFIVATNSHVATLNYDNLLYQPLIERKVLEGYSGALVDGFHSNGYSPGNLERMYGRNFGYYLHLHGSPLFVDRGENVIKLHQCDLSEQTDTVSSHIVLTHFKHKSTVISASQLLYSYWRKLAEAINESEQIILFGYSGSDEHLNSLIRTAPSVAIQVVEWEQAGEAEDRIQHWSELLSREITLVRKANILEFEDWAGYA